MSIKPVITDDLVLYLPLNEGTGTTAYDISGNGNNGTLINGPVWSKINYNGGYAIKFDSVDDYIETPRVDMSSGKITLSFWLNLFEVTTQKQMLSQRDGVSVNNWQLYSYVSDNTQAIFIAWGTSTNSFYSPTGYLETGWHHYVVSTDGTSIKWYKDGINVKNETLTINTLDNTTGSTIHMGSDHYGDYGNGIFDEVRIYNKILTSEEIKAIYKQTYRV